MKIFRTNRLAFEGLKLSLELYRLDKSQQSKDVISFFLKTILYDAVIDISLLMTVFFSVMYYEWGDARWMPWLLASAGVYGLEIINKIILQYYSSCSELDNESRARCIVNQAPKYILFSKKEKEKQFDILYRKFMKGEFNMS